MPPIQFQFATSATANRLVAGIPAAARLAHAWHTAQTRSGGTDPLVLSLADGGTIDQRCQTEMARLAPLQVVVTLRAAEAGALLVAGETLPGAEQMAALLLGHAAAPLPPGGARQALARAHRDIVRGTGKAGDGIVSRWINRPLSQAVTHQLLRIDWIRPGHATALTALVATAMLACLLGLGQAGLVMGAVLFQCASIADGIDGEIARATWRSSRRGAAWDSSIDALTNIGFIGGLAANLWQQGATDPALAGLAGLVLLATGMAILGIHARARGEPLNFDGAKTALANHDTPVRRWLRYITMRDFYCLFFSVMIVFGFATEALMIFALAAAAWLAAIMVLLYRTGTA